MKLEQYLKEDLIFVRNSYDDTDAFYADFSLFLKERGVVVDNEKIKRLFIKRENIQSTAIGRGVAAPHIFSDEFSEFIITIALIKSGMEYKSPDGKPVHVIFLIMSDDRDVGLHLKTLAHIARLEKSTALTQDLKNADTQEEILEVIKKVEKLV